MKTILSILPLFILCGCLSPVSEPSVSYWLMEFRDAPAAVKTPKYGIGRLAQVVVNLPYAGDRLVVLKKNGAVALDDYNLFAAPPSSLLKGVCFSALKSSGLFADVVGASSGVSASVSVEFVVTRLALDCRQEEPRRAVVELVVRVLEGRSLVVQAEGKGVSDATDGDYGVAFSKAVSSAVSSALQKLK